MLTVNEDRKAYNRVLATVPQQRASQTGELVFNVLWSYVTVMATFTIYIV